MGVGGGEVDAQTWGVSPSLHSSQEGQLLCLSVLKCPYPENVCQGPLHLTPGLCLSPHTSASQTPDPAYPFTILGL